MKILITAGGTSEKIDDVRCITNQSSGALGRALADAFLRLPQTERIFYVCGQSAKTPPVDGRIRLFRVMGVSDLQDRLTQILTEEKVDGIVHCMAVSDYTVDCVTTAERLGERLEEALRGETPDRAVSRISETLSQCLSENGELTRRGKISSGLDNLLLVLKRTPKIIDLFQTISPDSVLVGFKLLDRVPRETLLQAGRALMARSGCDFVFANDKAEVTPENHRGYLLERDGGYETLSGRESIAAELARRTAQKIAERGTAL